MEGTRSVQTAFRLRPELMERIKNDARRQKRSVNNLVEEILENTYARMEQDREQRLREECAQIDWDNIKIHEGIEKLSKDFHISFSQEEIEKDERLAYILSK